MNDAEGSSDVRAGEVRLASSEGDTKLSMSKSDSDAEAAEEARVKGCMPPGRVSQPRVVSSCWMRRRIMASGTREPVLIVCSALIPRGV